MKSEMITRLLLLCCFFIRAAHAQSFDEQYYPERLEWHNVEHFQSSGQRYFVPWDEGDFLRLRSDKNGTNDEITVWYSLGDGLFQQMKPVNNDNSQRLFARPKNQPLLVMFDNVNGDIPLDVDLSKHRKPPRLSVVNERILHPDNQVHTNQTGGFSRGQHNQIKPEQAMEYVLEGPAQYRFVMRTQWLEQYGMSQLMELQLNLNNGPTQTEVLKLQPQTGHLLQTDWCECVYSRAKEVQLNIPEGTHTVRVKADREILGFWSNESQPEQFFYQRNAHKGLISLQPEPLQRQDYSSTGLDNVPALYFYRELPPNTEHAFSSVKPLATGAQSKLYQDKKWPFNRLDAIEPVYFAHVEANKSASYTIPNTSHQPPLRLYLKTDTQLNQATMSLVTDAGERVVLRYFSEHKLTLPHDKNNNNSPFLLNGIDKVAVQFIEFEQPFTSLKLTNLNNDSNQPLELQLTYKNRAPHKTDELGFINGLDAGTATKVINVLSELPNKEPNKQSDKQPGEFDSVLLTEEIRQWQKRMRARIQSLLLQYPQQYPPGENQASEQLMQNVTTVMSNLGVDGFEALIAKLQGQGMGLKAKKLIGAFAMQVHPQNGLQAKWQQIAQKLMLQSLTEQGRWYDIEGFWAYRFVGAGKNRSKQKQAFIALTQVLFRQNRFEQASKWFWLAYQGGLIESVPDEAIISAYITANEPLLQRWFELRKRKQTPLLPLLAHRSWQPVDLTTLGNSARQLVHNQGLDSYFGVIKLSSSATQKLQLTGPLRLKLTIYPQNDAPIWSDTAWVILHSDKNQRRYLLNNLHDSLSLVSAVNKDVVVGSPKTIIVDLAQGEQLKALTLQGLNALFTVHQWRGESDEQVPTPVLIDSEIELTPTAIMADDTPVDSLLLQALRQYPLPDDVISAINARVLKDANKPITPARLSWLKTINHQHGWQRLQSVLASSGEKTIEDDVWQPASTYLQLQKALLTKPMNPGERILSANNSEIIEFNTAEPRSLMLGMRQMQRLGDEQMPVMINIALNGQSESLSLNASQMLQHPLELPAGKHRISVSFDKTQLSANHPWVCFSLADQQLSAQPKPKPSTSTSLQRKSVLPLIRRKYHVSTDNQPLVIFAPDSSWLRIDEMNDSGQLNSRHRYVETAQKLTLPPTTNHSSYYRVYQWQADKLKQLEPLPQIAQTKTVTHAPVQQTYWILGQQDAFNVYDKYPVAEQEDGSWGLFSGFKSRRNFDEDEQTPRERFSIIGWRYQLNLPELNSHVTTALSMRSHQNNTLQTLVSENDGVWRLNRYWDFTAKINAYYQARADYLLMEGAWSVYASTSARWKQYFDNNVDNKVIMTMFARALSLSESDVFPRRDASPDGTQGELLFERGLGIDDDVWTDYKEDNRWGLRIADTLQYTPWLDTQLRLNMAVTSNTNGNFIKLHKYAITGGIRQYWQPFILKADLQHSRYYRDKDDVDTDNLGNRGSFTRSSLRLGLTWEQWSGSGQLWQIDSYVNKDLDSGESSFGLMFNWDLTDGQGFDDFAPSKLPFGSLRKRDSFHAIESNQVTSDSHD